MMKPRRCAVRRRDRARAPAAAPPAAGHRRHAGVGSSRRRGARAAARGPRAGPRARADRTPGRWGHGAPERGSRRRDVHAARAGGRGAAGPRHGASRGQGRRRRDRSPASPASPSAPRSTTGPRHPAAPTARSRRARRPSSGARCRPPLGRCASSRRPDREGACASISSSVRGRARESRGAHVDHRFQSCALASRAPSASAANFAHPTLGSISRVPACEAKPQSLPIITFSRPTSVA